MDTKKIELEVIKIQILAKIEHYKKLTAVQEQKHISYNSTKENSV